jgi:hypothetical protein
VQAENSSLTTDGERGSWPKLSQPGLNWRSSTQRQMALAGVPARYNKVIVVIRQYGPTFATAPRRHPMRLRRWLPDIYLLDFIYNSFI